MTRRRPRSTRWDRNEGDGHRRATDERAPVGLRAMQSADGLGTSEISRRRWRGLAAPLVPWCPLPSCVPRHVGPAAYPQYEAEAQTPQKRRIRRSMNIGHAPARRDTGTPLTIQPNPTGEIKM